MTVSHRPGAAAAPWGALQRSLAHGLLLSAAAALVACSSADTANLGPTTPTGEERNTEIVHRPCVAGAGSRTVDANGDGQADVTHVYDGGREVCRIVDLNMDRLFDSFVYFAPDGTEARRESDYDRDGRADEIITLERGVVVMKERETNYDDRIDTWDFYQNGKIVRRERDADGDGLVDQWWQFDPNDPKCAVVARDENGDRKPDPSAVVDLCKKNDGSAPAAAPPGAPATAPTTPMAGPPTGAVPTPPMPAPGGTP